MATRTLKHHYTTAVFDCCSVYCCAVCFVVQW